MAFIHELEDRWASALAVAPLEGVDIYQSEIKRAAKELVRQGKGQFMFDQQLSDLSTYWRDDELEQVVKIEAPPDVEPMKMRRVR